MSKWRLIISSPADGPQNMASDEALLVSGAKNEDYAPALRIYTWSKPCITTGYFQKHAEFAGKGLEVTRRPTGGLAVKHGADISYGFAAGKNDWPYVYDQENSYRLFHDFVRTALDMIGIKSEFYKEANNPLNKNPLCVQTFFTHDLHIKGRKVVGSSQRRRGNVLLQQGSIHIDSARYFKDFSSAALEAFTKATGIAIEPGSFTGPENAEKDSLFREKYTSDAWNLKF